MIAAGLTICCMITNSFITISSLRSAYQKVKANHGCAGVDRVTVNRFGQRLETNLTILYRQIHDGRYEPLPLLKILVAKKNGEARGLCIPTVRDRVAQRAVLDMVEPVLEKEFEECSFAYRRGRSVRQAVYHIHRLYNQGYRYVVDADIDAFFDNVDHGILFSKVRAVIHDKKLQQLIFKWVTAEVWDGNSLFRLKKGIPQGSSISPVLANLFLDELDEAMQRHGMKYIRYADDYVVLCKTRKKALNALALSQEVLQGLKLELDEADVRSFDEGFKYLGVIFLRSMVMKPFSKQKKKRRVIFYPAPFDIEGYLRSRHSAANE